jgi:hypothetical protein
LGDTRPKRDIVVIWLPKGRRARLSDFAQGELFDGLKCAVTRGLEAAPGGMQPWVCWDKKFVLSPEDVSMAHAQ